jgi:TorA maturation chaperone TorD
MPSGAPARPAQVAELRWMVYRVLADLFLYPEEDRLASLVAAAPELRSRSEPFRGLPFSAGWDGLLASLEALDDDGAERLRDGYTTLFLAGGRGRSCAACESAYSPRGGVDAGMVAAEVERAYASVGLVTVPRERPDHLAVELEFMSFLCAQEARADGLAGLWRGRQRSFLSEHLLRWLPRFVRALRATTRERFYPKAAEVALAFAAHDPELIDAYQGG